MKYPNTQIWIVPVRHQHCRWMRDNPRHKTDRKKQADQKETEMEAESGHSSKPDYDWMWIRFPNRWSRSEAVRCISQQWAGERGRKEDRGTEREDQAGRQRGWVSTAAGDNTDQFSSKCATVKCIHVGSGCAFKWSFTCLVNVEGHVVFQVIYHGTLFLLWPTVNQNIMQWNKWIGWFSTHQYIFVYVSHYDQICSSHSRWLNIELKAVNSGLWDKFSQFLKMLCIIVHTLALRLSLSLWWIGVNHHNPVVTAQFPQIWSA